MVDFGPVRHAVESALDSLPAGQAARERMHTEGVAACAVRLAEIRGEDPTLADIAARLHDLGRIAGGDAGRTHGKTGAILAEPLLASVDGLPAPARASLLDAIRRHGRKKGINDAFTELLKDADVWQLSRQGERFRPHSEKAVRLLLTEGELSTGSSRRSDSWPRPEPPERVAVLLREACHAFWISLAPLVGDAKDKPAPSRHAIHAIRQQARALRALLRHLAPLLPIKETRRMVDALEAVLEAVGPLRDLDVLALWMQKAVVADMHGNPDMSPRAIARRRRVPERFAAERTARLRAARTFLRRHGGALPLFGDKDLFGDLEAITADRLAACRDKRIRRLRRHMTEAAACMAEPDLAGLTDRDQHRFRIRAKEARTLLAFLYERPNGSHPCFCALMDALEDVCRHLGARRDAMAGTRLLARILRETDDIRDAGAALQALWRTHCAAVEARVARKVPPACFTIRKLL